MSPEASLLAFDHGGLWQEHAKYSRADWRADIANEVSQDSYWDWVLQRMQVSGDIPPDLPELEEAPNDE